MFACVVREVSHADFQFVPVAEVPAIKSCESIYIGKFRSTREQLGPYGSHTRTICLPVGKPDQFSIDDLIESAPELHASIVAKLERSCSSFSCH